MYIVPLFIMRNHNKPLFVLGGAAAGAVATYLLSKPRLRRELRKAGSVREALATIGTHVQRDASDVGTDARKVAGKFWRRHKLHGLASRFNLAMHRGAKQTEQMADDIREDAKEATDRLTEKSEETMKTL